MASSRRALAEFVGHDLRLHRLVFPSSPFEHQVRSSSSFPFARSPGSCGPLCVEETSSALASVRLAVSDQSDLDGIAQPDSRGIDIQLDASRLVWLGQELQVRKRRADDE